MTNREKFNSVYNDVLADMLCSASDGGIKCKFCCYTSGDCFGKNCFDGVKRWLRTNRNKFNAMDSAKLADILRRTRLGDKCQFCCYSSGKCFEKNKSCFDGIKMWLSAPCANEPKNPPADNLQKGADEVTRDNVNHPDHYNHGKIEVVDFIEDQHLGFHLGNAVKYISRAGRKDPARTVEDLRKAAWYLNRQIERLEGSLGGQNG